MDQSTASRHLKELERLAGEPLFVLEDRRYALTLGGKRWVKIAEEMERAFLKNLPVMKHAHRKKIRVTTFDLLANSFILPYWDQFGFDESIHYEFEASPQSYDLKSTRFDFAIRFFRPEHLGPLKMRKIATLSFGVVEPKNRSDGPRWDGSARVWLSTSFRVGLARGGRPFRSLTTRAWFTRFKAGSSWGSSRSFS
jgi:DNA-binding transcriptional LysR family regulator